MLTRALLAAGLLGAAVLRAAETAPPLKCFSGPESGKPIEFITIPGGTFMMGSALGRHQVAIKTFQLAKGGVTVAQYGECVKAGACTKPLGGSDCPDYPVFSVTWEQAKAFASWAGARLPTEAEREYAARSGGKEILYPWGNEPITCERAVIQDRSGAGCGRGTIWPPCSKPKGNSEQGVCDLAGNVDEWVEDYYHPSYAGAPEDGSAWMSPAASMHVYRGGSYGCDPGRSRATHRGNNGPGGRGPIQGFRLAR